MKPKKVLALHPLKTKISELSFLALRQRLTGFFCFPDLCPKPDLGIKSCVVFEPNTLGKNRQNIQSEIFSNIQQSQVFSVLPYFSPQRIVCISTKSNVRKNIVHILCICVFFVQNRHPADKQTYKQNIVHTYLLYLYFFCLEQTSRRQLVREIGNGLSAEMSFFCKNLTHHLKYICCKVYY